MSNRKRAGRRGEAAATTYEVAYPSGKRFTVRGALQVVPMPASDGNLGWCPCVDSGKEVLILDARAVIRSAGRVVYDGSGQGEPIARVPPPCPR
jgi:hypothetical protein